MSESVQIPTTWQVYNSKFNCNYNLRLQYNTSSPILKLQAVNYKEGIMSGTQ
jgi:hypothetical protein